MPRPKLWLHAGVHKTGTTAIQRFAAANREPLLEQGLWYPDFQPVRNDSPWSHNPLAHAIARPEKSRSFSTPNILELIKYWRENVGNNSLMVSAEALCRHLVTAGGEDWLEQRRAYVGRLAEIFADFDVEVVLALRRQDRWAHSVYLENIMKGSDRGKMSFPDFRNFLEKRHLRFEENIGIFEEYFGPVRVFTYEGLSQYGNLCRDFFLEFGIKKFDGFVDPGLVRPSLSMGQARLKRAFLPVIVSRNQNKQVNRLLGLKPLMKVSEWFWNDFEVGFWESDQFRRKWLESFDSENESLRQRHFPERPDLFSPANGVS